MKGFACLFPGQGSQYVGMGQILCEEFAIARETFAEANEALGYDLQQLCFTGDLDELTKTAHAQPAILTASIAAFRVYAAEIGVNPAYSAGHSLGEYSALVAAGALTLTDAVRLVRLRGQLMQQAVPVGEGAMMAVMGVKQELVEEVCAGISQPTAQVAPANYNSSQQVVISGHRAAVEAAGEELQSMGANVKMLVVSAPFHSPLMQPAADAMYEALANCQFGVMRWPVISNVSALPYVDDMELASNLAKQITSPVRWQESMEYLRLQGVTMALELGPKQVLKNILKKSMPEIMVLPLENQMELEAVRVAMPKVDLNEVMARSLGIIVCTQNHNWDDEGYRTGVVEPYNRIHQMLEDARSAGQMLTQEQVAEGLELLKQVLRAKKTPLPEQIARWNQLLDETGTRQLFTHLELPA